ncbi:patatin-like phospholipase family protein [Rhizobium bangladeshense]|uniref:Patatin-like phospholipase family protein n=1 Tax=Rhizobium bangladeshense TaxID=1138189 RepID=A0ABS7LN75_9HYPH|nr:patatin-like phospholipase family protein [Rhizobium bangladeshense]MBX4870101.1 patatin-like phospholipase family protein [Rhizobium bangladeshense]MBX4886423.1 patatin-like phospholipase family protein [Rhizobium bangladeshense]MBX4916865.1 patatin-like phospholipase family protein [Rhizobium bangladeshense]MBX4923007.1 patatin-like phospholipase family protein [Rhizobium bangladeshense]MBX4935594.1 patatin-like phospholipase family protein [Rhizobium bangladeshense]
MNKHVATEPGMQSDSSVTKREPRTINLALQGGGAHGAFTWGVLDRLLDEPSLSFEGIVATSAGAMNAAVAAYGLAEGGRSGAQTALANFWRRVSHAAASGPLQPTLLDRLTGSKSLEFSPAFIMFDLVTRLMSPYQFNPFNFNPLRQVLEQSIDLEAIRMARCPVKLSICATNVRTGKVKVFGNDELSIDAIMASACLPFLFQAVEIGGEAYWDGGYMGNPAIFPLIYGCDTPDVIVVHINPIERTELPRTAGEILNRINEISFNSSLLREMRAVAFVTQLIDTAATPPSNLKRIFVHGISDDEAMKNLSVASKLNADWGALMDLRDRGRRCADLWLETNYQDIGKRSTVDVRERYL